MKKEEIRQRFESNVEYLKRNIAPDDIYAYAEQNFMAAVFFLRKWAETKEFDNEYERDQTASAWVSNIVSFDINRNNGYECCPHLLVTALYGDECD